jgi:hypothetical protein
MTEPRRERAFAVPPDPGRVAALAELTEALRLLKVLGRRPPYDTIEPRINTIWRTSGRPPGELTETSHRRGLLPALTTAPQH